MNINATLFLQAIVFAILVWFTMRYIWPPLTKALDERAAKIAEGLSAADKAKTELVGQFVDQLRARYQVVTMREHVDDIERRGGLDLRLQSLVHRPRHQDRLGQRYPLARSRPRHLLQHGRQCG